MRDSVGLELGTSLQSVMLQLTNLLQNCYFCAIQKTISNSVLWSLVIKYFWPGCFAPPYLLRPGATAPLCPPLCYATATKACIDNRKNLLNSNMAQHPTFRSCSHNMVNVVFRYHTST